MADVRLGTSSPRQRPEPSPPSPKRVGRPAMSRRDRIADPWGARTPYGEGETWPQRTDLYLADGLVPDDVDRWVQSASVLHSNGDAMDIAVKDGAIVSVRG